MSLRRTALPLWCGAWIVGGFAVLAAFALLREPEPALPGLDAYPSAFIGDPLLLPVVGVILALGVERLAPGPNDGWWATGGGLLGLAGGVTTQVLWLTDDHVATNWTIPRPHHFNAAGVWHAVYTSLTCALLSALAIVVLIRLRRTARRSRDAAERIVGSPSVAVLSMAMISYVALVLHDSGVATSASRATVSALGVGILILIPLITLAIGRLALAMWRPVALGLLTGAAVAVLAQGVQGGHGHAFAFGLGVNIVVAAALAAYMLLSMRPPDTETAAWALLSGGAAALALCAEWILAVRAYTDRDVATLLALTVAEAGTLLICYMLIRAVPARGSRGVVEAFSMMTALSAMVWIAGPADWAMEWVRVANRDVVVGILLAVVVYWLLYPVVTARYDAQIRVEAALSGRGPLPAAERRATAAALSLVVLSLVATALALLSHTFQALSGTDYREGHGWPYRSLLGLGIVAGVVALCVAFLPRLRLVQHGRWRRILPSLLLLPWCAALVGTADVGMLHQSPVISGVLLVTSALCGWWAGNSLLDNVYLLRLRRVDPPGWSTIGLGAVATGLSAYWAGSVALVGVEHPWATLPALLGALGVLTMAGILTTLIGRASAPPAPTVTLYGLTHNLAQDAIVLAVLHTFAVVLPVIFLVHVPAGVDADGVMTTLAVCAPLLTLLACGYRWTAKNNTSHVRREIHARAADPAMVEALVLREARPWQRLRLQWTAARRGLPGPRQDRFLRVLAAHAHNQNLIGVLLLVPLLVGVLALVQERSSGVKVPWRD